MAERLELFAGGIFLWKCWGYFWATCVSAKKIPGAVSRGGQGVVARLSHLHWTHIAGQILLALGVRQGHGAGRQDVAGGFHLFPGLLVQVLWRVKNLLVFIWKNTFWLASEEQFPPWFCPSQTRPNNLQIFSLWRIQVTLSE